jgi:hypothetical protein
MASGAGQARLLAAQSTVERADRNGPTGANQSFIAVNEKTFIVE